MLIIQIILILLYLILNLVRCIVCLWVLVERGILWRCCQKRATINQPQRKGWCMVGILAIGEKMQNQSPSLHNTHKKSGGGLYAWYIVYRYMYEGQSLMVLLTWRVAFGLLSVSCRSHGLYV